MSIKKKIEIIRETIVVHFGEDFSPLQRDPYCLMHQLLAHFIRYELKLTILNTSRYIWGDESYRAFHAMKALQRKIKDDLDVKDTFEALQRSISKNLKNEMSISKL
jgi:hypothetical protein